MVAFEAGPGISLLPKPWVKLNGASPAMSSTDEVSVCRRECCCEVKEAVSEANSGENAKLVGMVDPEAGEDGSLDGGDDVSDKMGESAGNPASTLSCFSFAPPSRYCSRVVSAGGCCSRRCSAVATKDVALSQNLMSMVC